MTQRIAIGIVFVLGLVASASAQAPDGAELYKRTCAQCHDNGTNRAPNREAFKSLAAERVLAAMETGSMITMANNRTAAERRAIAEFLTGKSLVESPDHDATSRGDVHGLGWPVRKDRPYGDIQSQFRVRDGPAGDRTPTTLASRTRQVRASRPVTSPS